MTNLKILCLGFLILVALVLNTIGVYTPNWIVITTYSNGSSQTVSTGLVVNGTLSQTSANGLMIISNLLQFYIFLPCMLIICKMFSGSHRRAFKFISISSALVTVLTVISIFLIIPEQNENQYSTLGYSAWMFLIAAILYFFISFLSRSLLNDDWEEDEKEEPKERINHISVLPL